MTRTRMLILYTVECTLLFVTSMTSPSSVTPKRRVPSGDHATSFTLRDGQNQREQRGTYITTTLYSVHRCLCGDVGDAERIITTTSCHQCAVGGNRTPIELQTQPASDQQPIEVRHLTSDVCNLKVAFFSS